ncbi:MAG: phenylacetaldoxime dehydratase family protein [Gaiellales bacterium]
MTDAPVRTMADLSAYPDLVVIYLGMRVEEPRGVATLQALAPQIQASVDEGPDGLLLHERLIYSEDPPHYGMRQYWRDFESLEAWSRELPHKKWWTDYLRDRGGTSFWHETYFRRGGFESVYVDVEPGVGMGAFAPVGRATGPMFAARDRLHAERRGIQASA